MKIHHHFFLLLVSVVCVFAEPHKQFPKIDDTSYVEKDGERIIRLSVQVPGKAEEVWRMFSTAEGWKGFAVSFAEMEMKIGGIIETSYNPKAQRGDPDNIKNQLVAYIPGKMFAIRCVQTPRNFQHQAEFFSTATIIEIAPETSGKCLVKATSVGFKEGEAFDDLFKNFRRGNAYTLEKLRAHFSDDKPVTSQDSKPRQDEFGSQQKKAE